MGALKKRTIVPFAVKVELSLDGVTMFRTEPSRHSIKQALGSKSEYIEDSIIKAMLSRLDNFIVYSKSGMIGSPPILDIASKNHDAILYYTKVFSKF